MQISLHEFRIVRFSTTVPCVDGGLIQALGAAAQKARKDNGVSREQVAVALGRGSYAFGRFVRAYVFVALDDLLGAYVETTGASLLDLLSEAERTLKMRG
jgi:hypothetical protein